MDESEIKEIAQSVKGKLRLREALDEFGRSRVVFIGKEDTKWGELELKLKQAIETAFPAAVDWDSYLVVNPSLGETKLPLEVLEPYLRCNFYCAEYLDTQYKGPRIRR
jgi:hypothetical protein